LEIAYFSSSSESESLESRILPLQAAALLKLIFEDQMPIRGFEMKTAHSESTEHSNQLQGRGVGLSWAIMPLVSNHPTPDLRALVARLGGTWSGNTAMCRCPSHADRTPSLAIRQGDRGILVTCHAGCDAEMFSVRLRSIADLPSIGPAETLATAGSPASAYLAIWQAGRQIEGTLAERYVRDIRNIWAPLDDLRYHPRCPRGQGRLVQFEPALLVAMRKRARSPQSSGFFSIQ
jgi:hypothetical protein